MTKPKRSTALTLGDVLRSAAGALMTPQPDPAAPSPDAGSEPSPPAAAPAPAGEPIAPAADADTATTTPPPQAAPRPEEHPMTATPAPAAPPAPTTASVTVTPAQPTPSRAAPAVATRPRRWLYNPSNDAIHAFEVLPDGNPEFSFQLMREQRPEIIEVPEAFARAVLDGGPRPPLPQRHMPGLPGGLALAPDLAGQSTIG